MIALILAATVSALSPHWEVVKKPNPLDDKMEVTATLHGDGGDMLYLCSTGGKEYLALQPDRYFDGPPASYEYRDLAYRLDDFPAVQTYWKYQSDFIVAPADKRGRDFGRTMLTGKRMFVRASKRFGGNYDMTFDMSEATSALKDAVDSCK